VSTSFAAHDFNILNKCTYAVRIGILGTNTHDNITTPLAPGAKYKITIPDGPWSGRLWGKTDCDANGQQCASPNTLAEWTLGSKAGEQDFYDVSLVDGFNMPLRITPTPGTFKKGTNPTKYDCGSAGCDDDLNSHCPKELAVIKNGKTIACRSACAALHTKQYCCMEQPPTPQNCYEVDHPKDPATNPYPAMFKKACPDAYSYAYDDATSTFTCHGNPYTSYDIVFCSHL